MRKGFLWCVLALGLALGGILPVGTRDVADLLPARALCVWTEGARVCVRSDCGAAGSGQTLEAALADMEQTAEGVLFLDTAEDILLAGNARELTGQLARSDRLRPAARLYRTEDEQTDLTRAVTFLQAHPGGMTLGAVRAALLETGEAALPCLIEEEGRLRLLEG